MKEMDKIMENEKELINKNLEIIHKSKFRFSKYKLVNLKGKTSHGGFIKEMITILDSYDLIIESGDYIMLSPFGKEVIREYVSWIEYLKYKNNRTKNKIKKEDLDLKISKFQVATRNLPFIISIIGVLISGFAIYLTLRSPKEIEGQLNKQTKEQIMKKEQHKFYVPKKVDSTNSK